MIGTFSAFPHDIVFDERLFEVTGASRQEAWKRFGAHFGDLLVKEFKEGFTRICFFDLVGVMPPGLSRGFVLAPSEAQARTYLAAVTELLDGGYAVAGHPVFDAGLPKFGKDSIETPSRLNARLGQQVSPIHDHEPERRYYRSEPMGTATVDKARSNGVQLSNFKELCCVPLNDYDVKNDAEGVSRYGGVDRSICDNLDKFADLLEQRKETLCSQDGGCLNFLYAIPVSAWAKEKDSRNWKWTHFGSVFVGVSGKPLEDAMMSVLETLVVRTFGIAYFDSMLKLQTNAEIAERERHQTEALHQNIHFFIHDVGNLTTVMEAMLRSTSADDTPTSVAPEMLEKFDQREQVKKRLHIVNGIVRGYLESSTLMRAKTKPSRQAIERIVLDCISALLPDEGKVERNRDVHRQIVYQQISRRASWRLLDIKDENNGYVICDESKTKRALLNIIDNAIKHSSSEAFRLDVGWIVLDNDQGLRTCAIYVSDYGNGVVDPEHILYGRFLKGRHDLRRPGFGMGLRSAKELMSAHVVGELSGDVWHFNRDEGGATFVLQIPFSCE